MMRRNFIVLVGGAAVLAPAASAQYQIKTYVSLYAWGHGEQSASPTMRNSIPLCAESC
jgi:hypothetical protein